ncbi:MAG: histidine kinase, partial [Akkermansiaceae bacterium]|nr:histidine kinase [Akkermansiaceae bacterium]
VWVGTSDRGLRHFRDGEWREWLPQDGYFRDGVRSLLVASNGDLWIASLYGTDRLYRLHKGRVQTVTNTTQIGVIRALAECADGTIWIGTSKGEVQKVRHMTLVADPALNEPVPLSVRSLLATADGSLWIGYAGDGLGHLKDGRYQRLTSEAGLADDFVSQLLDDGGGNLWIAGNRGLSRVAFAELHAVIAGRLQRVSVRRYGSADGLPGVQPNRDYWPSAWQGGDGRLWFSLLNGLLVVQPGNISENPLPPRVQLERVSVDDQLAALYNAGSPLQLQSGSNLMNLRGEEVELHLAPGHRKLEIHFAALSFTSPENVQFRYQLSGFDSTWVEAGSRHSATYPRLPAGDYEFQVLACNNTGIWNSKGAVLAFTVSPFFWETSWFKAGGGLCTMLAAGGCAFAMSRARYRRRLRRLEARRALEQERSRIARDIHDELGSSLTRIVMLSQPDENEVATPSPEMTRINETARNLTRTMDEVVWAVNPRHDTLESLCSYLSAFAQEFTAAAHAICRLDFPERIPAVPLSAEARHSLFLAAKEAIHNAVRHGQAQVIGVSLQLQPGGFALEISDNGRGFEPGTQSGGRRGHGLENMHDRLGALGGRCEIVSRPGAGATIRFTVTLLATGTHSPSRSEN